MKEGQIPKEIQQPDIERPDMEDPLTWALLSRVKEEWIRQVGPQLDVDVEKYILGGVLTNITCDDDNVFVWMVDDDLFAPDPGFKSQKHLLEKMDQEINAPETPQNIREKLEDVAETVSLLNWRNLKEFKEARNEWYQLKEWVEEEMGARSKLQEAMEYYSDQAERLSPYWDEFLYGIKVEL